MRKTLVLLATATLTVGMASVAPAVDAAAPAPSQAPSAPQAQRSYTPPPIKWGECEAASLKSRGAECGNLIVPLDYQKPNGPTVRVAVSRLQHSSPDSQYQGIMVTNPGGPGGSGLTLSVLQDYVPDGAGETYDWIGFDPRGVGSSAPSLSCDRFFNRGDRPPYRPTKPGIRKQWLQRSKAYARRCAGAPGHRLFNHVKTIDTVHDINSLRKALGESKLNYYGFSYGTSIGQLYATTYPGQVRRFVFDGTVNSTRSIYRTNLDQDRAFQKTFNIYTSWLAKYSDVYHVGNTPQRVRNRYFRAIRDLDKRAAGRVLGGDELTDVFTSAGYYVYGWEDIAEAWSDYVTKKDASGLIELYGENTEPGADNGNAVYLGTQCTDERWPRNQVRLDRDSNRLYRQGYTFLTWSNAWFNGPCAYWKFPAAKRSAPISGKQVKSPILMIGETYDAATPFSGSLTVRGLFPRARLIEGKNGSTHAGSLSGVSCTDDAIAAYLEDGTIVARKSGNRADKVCPPVPRPDPTAEGAQKRATQDTFLLRLHQRLGRLG